MTSQRARDAARRVGPGTALLVAILIAMNGLVSAAQPASASTASDLTLRALARIGGGVAPSVAALRTRADGSGTLSVNLRGLPPLGRVGVQVDRGDCQTSTRLLSFVSVPADGAGAAARTYPLTAGQVRLLRASPAVVRLSAPGPRRCGALLPAPAGTLQPLFGTLLSDPDRSREEYRAGIRVVHLELSWAAYEPADGVFSSAYAADARRRLAGFRAAGMKVVLGLGLQYPPDWVFGYPDSRYVDQAGRTGREVNLTFNPVLRARADEYLHRVDRDLGLSNFWAVRVGAGGSIETLYPDPAGNGSFWAYDRNAQASSPYPGWRPGSRDHLGRPFSTRQVAEWYGWYLDALVDGVNWQIAGYRRLGFTGYVHVLMPGQGLRPRGRAAQIAGYLAPPGLANNVAARGAAWDQVMARITDRTNVVAYVSSVADGSGADDGCAAADASVQLTSSAVDGWSAARWITYNARRSGLATMGENPGRGDANGYGPAMLERAVAQMRRCGFQGLMWAHAGELYEPSSGVTLTEIRAVITRD